jgi:hypothetical protein
MGFFVETKNVDGMRRRNLDSVKKVKCRRTCRPRSNISCWSAGEERRILSFPEHHFDKGTVMDPRSWGLLPQNVAELLPCKKGARAERVILIDILIDQRFIHPAPSFIPYFKKDGRLWLYTDREVWPRKRGIQRTNALPKNKRQWNAGGGSSAIIRRRSKRTVSNQPMLWQSRSDSAAIVAQNSGPKRTN